MSDKASEKIKTVVSNDAYGQLTADERLLASLGYKQEFKRSFTALEVFGIGFSIIGLFPSIA